MATQKKITKKMAMAEFNKPITEDRYFVMPKADKKKTTSKKKK